MAVPAAAGPLVDPSTLQPPPDNAECRLDGAWTICHTSLVFTPVNEPIRDFQLPCGTLYETASDVRRGIRWYDSNTGKLLKRFVSQDFQGTWSLSPTGTGPAYRRARSSRRHPLRRRPLHRGSGGSCGALCSPHQVIVRSPVGRPHPDLRNDFQPFRRCWVPALTWAWEDLNLRLHPESKMPEGRRHLALGGHAVSMGSRVTLWPSRSSWRTSCRWWRSAEWRCWK
jgi:hypothetical protein